MVLNFKIYILLNRGGALQNCQAMPVTLVQSPQRNNQARAVDREVGSHDLEVCPEGRTSVVQGGRTTPK